MKTDKSKNFVECLGLQEWKKDIVTPFAQANRKLGYHNKLFTDALSNPLILEHRIKRGDWTFTT